MILQTKPIQTTKKIIKVEGKVFYNDRRRRIDVKRPIRDLFEDDSQSEIKYTMELCLSEERIMQRIKELGKEQVVPVLMYFSQGGGKNAD